MNSERRWELQQLVTFNKTYFHSLELLPRFFFFFFLHARGAVQTGTYSRYSMCPLCYRKHQKSFISGCLMKDLVLTRWIKVAAGVENWQNVCCRRSQRRNISSAAGKRCVGLSRHIQNALLTREFYAFCALLGTDGGTNACDYTFHRAQ